MPDSGTTEKPIPWGLITFGVLATWIVLELVPLALVLIGGSGRVILASPEDAAVAGTIGDSFGLTNSLFSGAALVLVIVSIHIQLRELRIAQAEWKENTNTQAEQVKMMKQAAQLSAIGQIYKHYDATSYSESGLAVLAAVAKGHKKWAIRQTFESFDSLHSKKRKEDAINEAKTLVGNLEFAVKGDFAPEGIASSTACLLVDENIPERFRDALWPIYDFMRYWAGDFEAKAPRVYDRFRPLAEEAVKAWSQCETSTQANPPVDSIA